MDFMSFLINGNRKNSKCLWRAEAHSRSWTYSSDVMQMELSAHKCSGKAAHTDQYLHFKSHHPANHKAGVVMTQWQEEQTGIHRKWQRHVPLSLVIQKLKEKLKNHMKQKQSRYQKWFLLPILSVLPFKKWELIWKGNNFCINSLLSVYFKSFTEFAWSLWKLDIYVLNLLVLCVISSCINQASLVGMQHSVIKMSL